MIKKIISYNRPPFRPLPPRRPHHHLVNCPCDHCGPHMDGPCPPCAHLRPLDPKELYINAAVKYGFNVTTAGVVGGILNLPDAIRDVPQKYRCLGQLITFYTLDDEGAGHWVTYRFISTNINDYERKRFWVNVIANEFGDSEYIAASQALVSQLLSNSDEIAEALDAETSAREAADEQLQDNIDAEASTREKADNALQDNIDLEQAAREKQDTILQNNIDAEASIRESADDALQAAIDSEAAQRIAADDALQANIDKEADERNAAIATAVAESIAGDKILRTLIDSEILDREQADNQLQVNIDNEVARAQAAEEALAQEIVDQISGFELVEVTVDDSTVEHAYELHDKDGNTLGVTAIVPKDRNLRAVAISTTDATYSPTTNQFVDGTGDPALCFAFELADGTIRVVAIDLQNYLSEAEFGDGLQVNNHIVSVKIDSTSEPYLTVSSQGIKLEGISSSFATLQLMIEQEIADRQAAVEALEAALATETSARETEDQLLSDRIVTEIADRKTADNVLQDEITSLQVLLDAEVVRAQTAENTLENNLNGLAIVEVNSTDVGVAHAYELHNSNGETMGATILVGNDRYIETVSISTVDATYSAATHTFVDGTGDVAICFAFKNVDGSYDVVAIDCKELFQKYIHLLYGEGLEMSQDDYTVRVLIDPESDEFLTVSKAGVKLSGVSDALEAEATARDQAVNAEAAERIVHDHELQDNIDAEVSRATSAEENLQDEVDTETARATEAEQTLQDEIDAITSDLQNQLDAEVSRAEAAEQTLQDNIDTETARAEAAESDLQSQLDASIKDLTDLILAEQDRAESAEQTLTDNLASEIDRAKEEEANLESLINSTKDELESELQSVSESLTEAIETETARATSAEQVLQDEIDDLNYTDSTTCFVNSVDQVKGQISVSHKELQGANAISVANDTSTVTVALNIDSSDIFLINNTSGLSVNLTMAKVDDNKLATNVREAFVLTDRNGGQVGEQINVYKDSSLKNVELVDQQLVFTYILEDGSEDIEYVDVSKFLAESEFLDGLQVDSNGCVSVKIDTSSDSYLSVSSSGILLSGVESAISSAAASSTTKVEKQTSASHLTLSSTSNSDGSTTYTIGESDIASDSDLQSETSRAKAAEDNLQNSIDTETSRATSAEQTLTSNLSTEVARAEAAENTLTSNLNSEITRASNAENTLTNNLNSLSADFEQFKTDSKHYVSGTTLYTAW